MEEFGIDCKNSLDRNTLINLAIDYILHQNKTALSRSFSVLPSTTLSKGNLQVLMKAFQGKNKNADDEFDDHLSEMEQTFGLQGLGAKDSLLNKLANLSTEESVQDKNAPNIQLPGLGKDQTKKQNLIQEMNSDNSEQVCETKEPDYKMEEKFNGEDLEKLTLTIKLPGVNKVSECELDISEVRTPPPKKTTTKSNKQKHTTIKDRCVFLESLSITPTLRTIIPRIWHFFLTFHFKNYTMINVSWNLKLIFNN